MSTDPTSTTQGDHLRADALAWWLDVDVNDDGDVGAFLDALDADRRLDARIPSRADLVAQRLHLRSCSTCPSMSNSLGAALQAVLATPIPMLAAGDMQRRSSIDAAIRAFDAESPVASFRDSKSSRRSRFGFGPSYGIGSGGSGRSGVLRPPWVATGALALVGAALLAFAISRSPSSSKVGIAPRDTAAAATEAVQSDGTDTATDFASAPVAAPTDTAEAPAPAGNAVAVAETSVAAAAEDGVVQASSSTGAAAGSAETTDDNSGQLAGASRAAAPTTTVIRSAAAAGRQTTTAIEVPRPVTTQPAKSAVTRAAKKSSSVGVPGSAATTATLATVAARLETTTAPPSPKPEPAAAPTTPNVAAAAAAVAAPPSFPLRPFGDLGSFETPANAVAATRDRLREQSTPIDSSATAVSTTPVLTTVPSTRAAPAALAPNEVPPCRSAPAATAAQGWATATISGRAVIIFVFINPAAPPVVFDAATCIVVPY